MQEFISQSVHHLMLNNSITIAKHVMFMINAFSYMPMASVAKSTFLSDFLEGRTQEQTDV